MDWNPTDCKPSLQGVFDKTGHLHLIGGHFAGATIVRNSP